MQSVEDARSLAPSLKEIHPVPSLMVGLASAALGLLPWMITGMRLPLQNLWATATPPEDMPVTFLPFSQYALVLLAAVVVMGSAVAGCAVRRAPAHGRRLKLRPVALGVVALQTVVTVQSALTVSGGLRKVPIADLYLYALIAGTVAAMLTGILVLLLIARAPVAWAAISMSIAGVMSDAWLGGIVLPFGSVSTDTQSMLLDAVRWVPAVVVGLILVWCGFNTIGRVFASITGLLLLWVGPAGFAGISAAAGTRVLAPYPDEMAEYGAQVFVSALGLQGGSLSLVVLAVIVAALGSAARWSVQRNRLDSPVYGKPLG